MRLALFDLDHTLIPFDGGMAWLRFLIERGILAPAAEDAYLAACRRYVAGEADIDELHRLLLAAVAGEPSALRSQRAADFERQMSALIPAYSLALVTRHRSQGDLCAIVTATARLIAEPFASLFGVEHLMATEAVETNGLLSGEIDGLPCHREHKLTHVRRWLGEQGLALEGFERSWFYSDSARDLPLLEVVTDPVAMHPDARLRELAMARGWRVIDE
jgi:HAD superfamily hydrolase (TIGR01490 family)